MALTTVDEITVMTRMRCIRASDACTRSSMQHHNLRDHQEDGLLHHCSVRTKYLSIAKALIGFSFTSILYSIYLTLFIIVAILIACDTANADELRVERDANLRVGPSRESEVVTTLRAGAIVSGSLGESSGSWIAVHLSDGRSGYVHRSLLLAAAQTERDNQPSRGSMGLPDSYQRVGDLVNEHSCVYFEGTPQIRSRTTIDVNGFITGHEEDLYDKYTHIHRYVYVRAADLSSISVEKRTFGRPDAIDCFSIMTACRKGINCAKVIVTGSRAFDTGHGIVPDYFEETEDREFAHLLFSHPSATLSEVRDALSSFLMNLSEQ